MPHHHSAPPKRQMSSQQGGARRASETTGTGAGVGSCSPASIASIPAPSPLPDPRQALIRTGHGGYEGYPPYPHPHSSYPPPLPPQRMLGGGGNPYLGLGYHHTQPHPPGLAPPISIASSWASSASTCGTVSHLQQNQKQQLYHHSHQLLHHPYPRPESFVPRDEKNVKTDSIATATAAATTRKSGSVLIDDGSSSSQFTPELILPHHQDDKEVEDSRSFDSSSSLGRAALGIEKGGRVAPNVVTTSCQEEVAAASVLLLAAASAMKEHADAVDLAATTTTKGITSTAPQAHGATENSSSFSEETTTEAANATATTNEEENSLFLKFKKKKKRKIQQPDALVLRPSPSPAAVTEAHSEFLPSPHAHFPSILHAVLTDSTAAGSVLLWLPHGQAWKIVRWDALRKQVLPKYFANLNNQNQSAEETANTTKLFVGGSIAMERTVPKESGSIDDFLWQLTAWGFEEIHDGPDAGAYSHVLFRRELPGLCRQMKFVPPSLATIEVSDTTTPESNGSYKSSGLSSSSPSPTAADRVILQVPSLNSSSDAATESTEQSNEGCVQNKAEEQNKGEPSYQIAGGLRGRREGMGAIFYPNQITPSWPRRAHMSLGGYQPHQSGLFPHLQSQLHHLLPNQHSLVMDASVQHHPTWKYFTEASQWDTSTASTNGMTTAIASPSSTASQQSSPPYSPIRVRSGRGACRLPHQRNRSSSDGATGVAPVTLSPLQQQKQLSLQSTDRPSSQPQSIRPSFPVSNRGKGRGMVPLGSRRISHPGSEASVSSLETTPVTSNNIYTTTLMNPIFASNEISPTVSACRGRGGVSSEVDAVRLDYRNPRLILKRKLPLIRKSSSSNSSSSSSPDDEDVRTTSPKHSMDDARDEYHYHQRPYRRHSRHQEEEKKDETLNDDDGDGDITTDGNNGHDGRHTYRTVGYNAVSDQLQLVRRNTDSPSEAMIEITRL